MTEKQKAEMLELADRIRDIAYSGVNNFDDFSSYKLDLIQDCAKKLQASLAAPSPHPRGEPVAWQFRQRSGIGNGPQRQAPWCNWCNIDREDYDRYNRKPNDLIEVRALAVASPPAGADAVREALEKQLAHYDKTIAEAESDYALSDTGRQRVIECCLYAKGAIKKFATTLLPAPQPQEKPTGDQP